MFCEPVCARRVEMVFILAAQEARVVTLSVTLLFCADAPCGKNETPVAKTRTRKNARVRRREVPAHALN